MRRTLLTVENSTPEHDQFPGGLQHDISHALLMLWVEKYRQGDLTDEVERSEYTQEYEAKITALERKIGQLVMELDLLKKRDPILPNAEPLSHRLHCAESPS